MKIDGTFLTLSNISSTKREPNTHTPYKPAAPHTESTPTSVARTSFNTAHGDADACAGQYAVSPMFRRRVLPCSD